MDAEQMREAAADFVERAANLSPGTMILRSSMMNIADGIRAIEIPRGHDPSIEHALKVLVWFVETYAPSSANSGAFVNAKSIIKDGVRACRVCGCSQEMACTHRSCFWVRADLCSECVGSAVERANIALGEMNEDERAQFIAMWAALNSRETPESIEPSGVLSENGT